MERKIGEIFEHNGEWYQCIKQPEDFIGEVCKICAFQGTENCDIDECSDSFRSDKQDVIFKKLEKVGEPYDFQKRTFQTYKLHTIPFLSEDVELVAIPSKDNNTIEIEIKQNKEDMGKYRRHDAKKDIPDKEKPNLKPFNLEQAKAGKPICTRDGRKARIICFDAKGDKPIIALIEMGVAETPNNYPIDGKAISTKETPCDLMMLPEKKEGWVNIYRGQVYNTFEKAKKAYRIAGDDNYLETIKVEWEE